MRNVHGKVGTIGHVVVAYLRQDCWRIPEFDYHWTLVKSSSGNRWHCTFCGAEWMGVGPKPGLLLGAQMEEEAKNMCFWLGRTPVGKNNDALHILKMTTAMLAGTLTPKLFEELPGGDPAAFTNMLRNMIEADGMLFFGTLAADGAVVEGHPIAPPITRRMPNYTNQIACSTRTQGMQVQSINLSQVAAGVVACSEITWDSMLAFVFSQYSVAGLLMFELCTQRCPMTGLAKSARKGSLKMAQRAYFKRTRLDLCTGARPHLADLEWLRTGLFLPLS